MKYKFDSVEELYSYYEHELFKRNQPYQEAFKEEQKHLKSLPVHPYELGRLQYAKANSFSLISIDGNFYSIPDKYVEKKVTCNIYDSNIIIYDDKNNLIAKHAKKDGKGEYSINIHHYIDTLLKKPKALKNSYAIKQAPEFLQSIYNQHFTTKPKEFLLLLKENDTFLDELNKLKINIGKSDRIQPDSLFDSFNEPNEVDIISIKQLNHTSLLFGQEV